MSTSNFSCIYPLVETIHSPAITFGETSCGLSCEDPRNFYLFLTSREEGKLKVIILTLSLVTICVSPVYFCLVFSRRIRTERFFSLPFTYQCPVFISSGYILLAFITMSPNWFGYRSIICNNDEPSITMNSFNNIPCSLTAIGVYIGMRVALFYNCTLSISLVLTLYYPNFVQLKRYYHIPVWTCISLGIIPLVMTRSIRGDYYLGFCTSSLNSRQLLLTLNIIPFSVCVLIFSVCLAMSTIKLLRHSEHLAKALSVYRDIRSLFCRLLLYSLLQAAAVAGVVGNFCYWYMYLDTWRETTDAIIICEVGITLSGETSSEVYELCVRDNSDLPTPPLWTYYFFQMCTLISVLGAIIFQCSLEMQRRTHKSLVLLRNKVMSLGFTSKSKMSTRTNQEMEMTNITFTNSTWAQSGTATLNTIVLSDLKTESSGLVNTRWHSSKGKGRQ